VLEGYLFLQDRWGFDHRFQFPFYVILVYKNKLQCSLKLGIEVKVLLAYFFTDLDLITPDQWDFQDMFK